MTARHCWAPLQGGSGRQRPAPARPHLPAQPRGAHLAPSGARPALSSGTAATPGLARSKRGLAPRFGVSSTRSTAERGAARSATGWLLTAPRLPHGEMPRAPCCNVHPRQSVRTPGFVASFLGARPAFPAALRSPRGSLPAPQARRKLFLRSVLLRRSRSPPGRAQLRRFTNNPAPALASRL